MPIFRVDRFLLEFPATKAMTSPHAHSPRPIPSRAGSVADAACGTLSVGQDGIVKDGGGQRDIGTSGGTDPVGRSSAARHPLGRATRRSPGRSFGRAGFTMVELMIAAALLGFSLVVMFGFHSQAVRSNMNARRLTDCTYLAQTQMERLLAMDWDRSSRPGDLYDAGSDASLVGQWDDLEQPSAITPVGVTYGTAATSLLPTLYTVTWDVEDMTGDETWVRLRVRCTYEDSAFSTRHGTTISSYRYRDS